MMPRRWPAIGDGWRGAAVVVAAVSLAVAAGAGTAAARDRDRGGDDSSAAAIVASCVLPRPTLAPPVGTEPAVTLGGISDLFVEAAAADGVSGIRRAWLVTDRGPNGVTRVDGHEQRTLAAPSFTPRILEAIIEWDPRQPGALAVTLTGTLPLCTAKGNPVSGRPNGLGNDPLVFDPQGRAVIEPHVDGVDTEGLVRTRAGTFWLAEEYRPSLLAAAGDATLRRRFVPAGVALEAAGVEIVDALPAVYAQRRDNRGFEALAIAPDETRLFALLQSPLDGADPAESRQLGNVRLLAFDPAAGRPVAEYLYRLGDPEERGYRQGKAAPDDGKLCAMAALGATTLLVLEQAGGGVARLYRAELSGATDTLPQTAAGGAPPLETLRDVKQADVRPVAKTLVADLAPLLPAMRGAVAGEPDAAAAAKGPLKIEGLAVLDARHVALVNDDDFGVREDAADDPRSRTCLWVVRLPGPLVLTQPSSSSPIEP
jgi:hypothetical protein